MLFDLTGRGRRNFVRVIYLGLAILMGSGLLLFGIGTGGSGGLFDAFSGNGSDTTSQVSSAEKRANREVRLHPQDAAAWADLTRARYQAAGVGGNYQQDPNGGVGQFTRSGLAKLETAATAWQRYLTLEPDHPDPTLARLMANAYAETGLDKPADAAAAMEIVSERQPSAASYATLAQYAWMADQTRKGDLAAAKAVDLTPATRRRLVRGQLTGIKKRIAQQKAQEALGGAAAGG